MNGRLSIGAPSRERHRKILLPWPLAMADYGALLTLIVLPAGVIWVLGGNRDWVMMPSVLGVLTAAAVFLYRFLVSSFRTELAVPPAGWLAFLFLGYLGINAAFSKISYESVLQLFKFSSYVLAYWMWFNLLRINGRWRWALALVVLSTSMMACFAIIQDVQGTRSAVFAERDPSYGMRASGAYICPNHFAHLLAMIILVSTGLLLSRKSGAALKLFAGYAVMTSLYPLILSGSRSGWIGLVAGLAVLALAMASGKGFKKLLAVALIAPIVIALASLIIWKLSPAVQERVHDALTVENIRIPLWKDSVDVALLSPWIGNGLGSYRHLYPHYRNHVKVTNDPEFAHNEFLHFWGEIGLVGVAIGALLIFAMIYRALRQMRDQSGEPGAAGIPASIMAVITGSWIHAFFDFNFNIFGNVHVYVFVLAALFAAHGNGRRADTITVSSPAYRFAGIFWIALLVLAGGLYAQRMASYYDYLRGEARMKAHDWEGATADFTRAIGRSENNWRAHLALADIMRTRAFWMRNPEIREKWTGTSLHHYEIAGGLNPWAGNVWYGIGMVESMRGNQDAALAMMRKAADEIPRNVAYLNAVGLQLVRMKRFEDALAAFKKSMDTEANTTAERNIQMLSRRLGVN